MYDSNIQNLITNLPLRNCPLQLDIVLEGGGFNGSYELGVLYFLKELVNQSYITVGRVSGASIGSLLAACFLTDNLDAYVNHYKKMREAWKKTIQLELYGKFIESFVNSFTTAQFDLLKNDTLYVTFFDVCKKTQITQSNFSDRLDLIQALRKSAYIPCLTDGNACLYVDEQFFIDGGQPFIFHDRECHLNKKILYVSINHVSKMTTMFTTKNERNACGRILEGILDCYDFFLHGHPTKICSFVHQWSSLDFIKLRTKHLLLVLIVYGVYYSHCAHTSLTPYLEKNALYKQMKPIFHNLYKDFILYFCF